MFCVQVVSGGTRVVGKAKFILLVEDSSADVFLVREALSLHKLPFRLVVLDDGEKAIRWVQENAATDDPELPAAVLLDLNLPRRTGVEVLDVIRSTPKLLETPVIVWTSSTSDRDREQIENYPSTRYFQKSADYDECMEIGDALREMVAGEDRV